MDLYWDYVQGMCGKNFESFPYALRKFYDEILIENKIFKVHIIRVKTTVNEIKEKKRKEKEMIENASSPCM